MEKLSGEPRAGAREGEARKKGQSFFRVFFLSFLLVKIEKFCFTNIGC